MDFNKAVNLLGVAENASYEEIDNAYKQLAQKRHPDKGGSEADMIQLNKARIFLLEHLSAKSLPLVQKQLELAIQKINDISITQKICARKVEKIERNILKIKTNKLQKWKQISFVLTGISAAALFIDKDFLDFLSGMLSEKDDFEKDEVQDSIGMIYIALFSVGAIVGFIAWCLSRKINKVEENLLEFHDDLSNKHTYIELMKIIFGGEIPKLWNLKMMNDALNNKYYFHANKLSNIHKNSNIKIFLSILDALGPEKTAQLLILKGQEYSFLNVSNDQEDNEYANYYALK